jgi:serine kinase of HPr protein (carbohydrate metabolism regulator)
MEYHLDFQATAVSYKNQAVLITGPSGVGKTALALRLIENGAVLIGDDIVEIFIKNNQLYCKAKEKLKGIIEVRGLGLVAGLKVKSVSKIACQICLHPQKTERLPEFRTTDLMGKKIPVFDFYACETNFIQVLYALKVLNKELTLLKE